MAKQQAKPHVHKFKRGKYKSGTEVYFCMLNCSYRIEVQFALGKLCICHTCHQEFEMNEYSIKLARPHCKNCGKHKVIGSDGKARFIAKGRQAQAMQDLAHASSSSLRERLAKVVSIARDEDI